MSDPSYLSLNDLQRARGRYYLHSVLNGVSFRLLAGNIITLYALRLGASNFFVGILSSMMHISMLFLLVGRPLVGRMGAVKLQSVFWAIRYLMMIPAVTTVLPAIRSRPVVALTLVAIGVMGFHTSKSIALAGQRAILGLVTGGRDRGAILARLQSMNTTFSTVAWLLVGIILNRSDSLSVYAATFGAGIVFGLGAAWALSGIPEPQEAAISSSQPLWREFRQSLKGEGYRRLTGVVFMKNLFLGMTGPFLIVYFKRVFLHTDGSMVFITLAGSLGVIAMAAVAGLAMDRLGARPLFVAFTIVASLTLVVIVLAPVSTHGLLLWVIPCLTFFLYQAGAMGADNCAQDYFFAVVRAEQRVNLGIIHNITAGIAGFIGSLGGGLLLDLLENQLSLALPGTFRVYFTAMLCGFIVVIVLVARLPAIGSYSLLNTLSVLFSPRDLRSLRLARRLGHSRTQQEEQNVVQQLGASPSAATARDLLSKLRSPTFAIRAEVLNALRNYAIEPEIRDALIDQILEHQYTTAHIAAELAGIHGVREAVPALRQAVHSEDFMLSGKAIISLARLGDRDTLSEIEQIFEQTENPRLVIHCVRAFAILQARHTVRAMVDKLRPRIAPHIRDEIIVAIAETLGMGDWFYELYTLLLENQAAGISELRSRLEGADPDLANLIDRIPAEQDVFVRVMEDYLKTAPPLLDSGDGLADTASVREAVDLTRFRFLVCAWLVRRRLVEKQG